MSDLRIAPDLRLDPDYVGAGTFALLAKKGAGKSYAARVMAEEFWKAKVPFVFMDPMGTSWGLRSSADGKGEGIPVAIFGGEHGDAPLERTSGSLLADLVVDEGLSMILDMSSLGSRAAERQFALDFFERLYRRNKHLVHLLVDEADLFAPQKPQAGDRQLLGVTENLVRRGRNRGIGITLLTQRPAVLNKDVLTQVDGLVAMRIVGLTDREAIDKWVEGHGDDPQLAHEVKGTLASLADGECWWWIPELGILQRVQVRRSHTFDSSPSQTRGGKAREPKGFADVDMGAIEGKMASTIERAKAEDPKELRARVAELQRELDKRPKEVEQVEVPVEVPVIREHDVEQLEKILAPAVNGMGALLKDAQVLLEELRDRAGAAGGRESGVRSPGRARSTTGSSRPVAAPKPRAARPEPAADGSLEPTLDHSSTHILDALAALEVIGAAPADRTQLALFAQASPKSSGYTNNLGALRTAGLIDYPVRGTVSLTDAGRELADAGAAPSTASELQEYVRSLVGRSRANLLDVLIEHYPEPVSKSELADLAYVSASSSGYTNNLGSLRSLRLIDYPQPGYVIALPVLFLESVPA